MYVQIGGIDQWVQFGENQPENPVLRVRAESVLRSLHSRLQLCHQSCFRCCSPTKSLAVKALDAASTFSHSRAFRAQDVQGLNLPERLKIRGKTSQAVQRGTGPYTAEPYSTFCTCSHGR